MKNQDKAVAWDACVSAATRNGYMGEWEHGQMMGINPYRGRQSLDADPYRAPESISIEHFHGDNVWRDDDGNIWEKRWVKGDNEYVEVPQDVELDACTHVNTHMNGWKQVCDDCGQGREIA